MKKHIIAVILLLPVLAFAQSYTFSVKQEPYQKLQHSIAVTPPGVMRGIAIIHIGFRMPFYFFGLKMDSITMFSRGYMGLTQKNNSLTYGVSPCAAWARERYPDWSNMYSSTMEMDIDTVNNKRITKLEYNNVGFNYDNQTDTTNFFNAQVWFYEDSNIVEFHYGPSRTDNAVWMPDYEGPYAGIDSAENAVLYNITGNSANPVISSNNSLNLDQFPANGTVYRFTPTSNTHTGVKEVNTISFNLYPNPANDNVTIALEQVEKSCPKVILMDIQGRTIKTITETETAQPLVQIPLNDVPAGIYFVRVETASGSAMGKLLVQ